MTAALDVRRLLREMERSGWTVQRTRSDHYKLIHPSGEFVFMASTPSCHRWEKNVRARIRRIETKANEEQT